MKLKNLAITVTTDRGHYTTLTDFLSAYPRPEVQPALPPARKTNSYSSRRICRLLNQPEEDWSTDEKALLTHLLTKHESIQQVHTLSQQFRNLMKEKSATGFTTWCDQAEQLPAYGGFVRGLRQDYAAVEQAFSSEWSNGQTEGQVNRLKMLKRQMYGRAGFDLLRVRVLYKNCTFHPD